jgi:hypothetical protein
MVLCGHYAMVTLSEQEGHLMFQDGSADLKFIRQNILNYEIVWPFKMQRMFD